MADADTKYPECEKLAAVHDKRMAIIDFLEWAETEGMMLAEYYNDTQLFLARGQHDDFAMRYFGIDMKKLDKERRAIIGAHREIQE